MIYWVWRTSKGTHPYQRGRASLTGLVLKLRKIIQTGRLIGVAASRIVSSAFLRGERDPNDKVVKVDILGR